MKTNFLLAFFALFAAPGLYAQVPVAASLGQISPAELSMDVYAQDTSAVAVVLEKKHLVEVTLSEELEPKRVETVYRRIKILKEAGKEYGDYQLLCYQSANTVETIRISTAMTCNQEDGKLVRTYLSKEDIHEDDPYENTHRYSFSMPNVRVGSVIELVFVLESPRYWDVGRLDLQEDIPVLDAGVEVTYPSCFEFNRIKIGYLEFSHAMRSRTEFFQIRGGPSFDMLIVTDIISAKDLPAVNEDDHCFCPSQYGLAVQYEMDKLNLPGVVERDFSTTWDKVDASLVKEGFLKACTAKPKFSKEVAAAAAAAQDEKACIAALRDLVCTQVRYNGKQRLFPSLAGAQKKGEGSSADVNALLSASLIQCGYAVDPVLVKSRRQGTVLESLPSVDMFDTFILRVKTPSGQQYFVDATAEEGYLDVLPPSLLSDHGRILYEKKPGEWIDLGAACKGILKERTEWEVTPEGVLSGTYSVNAYNEEAYDLKEDFREAKDEDAFIEALEQLSGCECTDFEPKGMDIWSPEAAFTCTVTRDPSSASSDRLYIRPFVRPYHSVGSFRSPSRTVPVDFRYQDQIQYVARLKVPEGYVVEELPADVGLAHKWSGSQVQLQCVHDEAQRTVTLSYRFSSTALQVLPNDYDSLRAFWGKMCDLYNAVIVLKRQ